MNSLLKNQAFSNYLNQKVRFLLDKFNNNMNAVIVSTILARDVIKSNYPGIKLVASRIFNRTEIDDIKSLCNEKIDFTS